MHNCHIYTWLLEKSKLCWTFFGKVMSLLFNMLCRLVIAFLTRRKHLLTSWLQSPYIVILVPKKRKSLTVSTVFPSICHEVIGTDSIFFVFWMLSFKPTFSVTSFTYIKRLFSSSSLYAVRVVSSAYLRLLIFLLAILTPGYASSSLAFHMMYSAYKLNKQSDNIQPFSVLNQSIVPVHRDFYPFENNFVYSKITKSVLWKYLTEV